MFDFLLLLAENANEPKFDENFVKWLAGFLVVGYAPLLLFLKLLLAQRKELLENQIKEANARNTLTESIRKELEGEIRKRFLGVIQKKDEEIEEQDSELKEMRVERLHMLAKQIEDGHDQEASLEKVTQQFNSALSSFQPIVEQAVDVLEYYRRKRERH